MSPKNSPEQTDFIPLSVAVTLVTYSRDYIGRLAREGKIKSTQIDKQWFVSKQSLVNFFEHSAIEDSVKKRILSLSRKNDLEVKDFYTTAVTNITARQTLSRNVSLFMSILILAGGLFSGVVLHSEIIAISKHPDADLSEVLASLQLLPSQASVINSVTPPGLFSDESVIEVTEKIPMEGGVVLFPTVNQGDEEMVKTLFSDDVSVVVTSTTTGFVRSKNGDTNLPFVRVPNATP